MMYERMMMHMLTCSNKLIYIIYNAFEIPNQQVKTNNIMFRRFGDLRTPLNEIKLHKDLSAYRICFYIQTWSYKCLMCNISLIKHYWSV